MLKGAIFDIDGTLIDSVDAHAQAWSQAFTARGHDVAVAAARGQIGKGSDYLLPVFLDPLALERDGEAVEAEHGRIFRERFRPAVQPFP